MDSIQLLTKLHEDLKKLNIHYDGHVNIQMIINAYKNELSEKEKKK